MLEHQEVIKSYLGRDWAELLGEEFSKGYMKEIFQNLRDERREGVLCPNMGNIFRAFQLTPIRELKVVILGQDPYHTPGVADGLAFSCSRDDYVAPSLRNVFAEIQEEYDEDHTFTQDLTGWAKQGVFLLNTILSTREGSAKAHEDWGWEEFTSKTITKISEEKENVVFMLWGNHAKKFQEFIKSKDDHLILTSWHPSPLSCSGFFGNNHFVRCNEYLQNHNKKQINWFI